MIKIDTKFMIWKKEQLNLAKPLLNFLKNYQEISLLSQSLVS